MAPHILDRDWAEYLGGALRRERAVAVRAHIDQCPECAAQLAEFERWHNLAAEEGRRLKEALRLPDEEMDRFVDRSVARICQSGPAAASKRRSAAEGMFLLQSLIEPIVGTGTARAAMDLAVRRCTVRPEAELTGSDWPLFVRNLSETLASVCGSAAGRLVNRAGAGLVEQAA